MKSAVYNIVCSYSLCICFGVGVHKTTSPRPCVILMCCVLYHVHALLCAPAPSWPTQRLEGYPDKALTEGCHRARAVLPLPLAAALRADPQLVAAAVEAFYYRWARGMSERCV